MIKGHAGLVESEILCSWLTYDGYVSHHYLYMAKVKQDVEPMSYENAIGNVH